MERNSSQTLATDRRTQLFSFLALLNAYIPEAYLLMSECQKILGPPDPIHGGPPFEERMGDFTAFIKTSSPRPGCVCMINQEVAQESVEELAISRSATVKKFMLSLCIDQTPTRILQYVKDLLIKRKCGVKGKEKFSRLIEDIREEENFYNALSVLKTASDIFRENQIYPQTISRFYYTTRGTRNYGKAEEWAKESIIRAPNNSFVADTLGQVYKNRLMREARRPEDILHMAEEAFKAFKDVERKADKEEGPEMRDVAGTVSFSSTFNNRGLFGFIQVAKIALEKLNRVQSYSSQRHSFIQRLKMEVEAKFDFFEWYLAYSKPAMTSVEPLFFWKDVVLCYELFTTKTAAESTSFQALLDCLNRGRFSSKGRRAGFEEAEETVSDLEAIQEDLKTAYEANVDDVKAAERYILSNIILSNKMRNSPKLTLVKELQRIIHRFLDPEVRYRSPEFYLLVLLLFWPEEEPQEVQEEDDEEQQSTEDEDQDDDGDEEQEQSTEAEDQDDEDNNEEQETRGEPAQQSLDLMFNLDQQQYVTFMKKAFEGAGAKYLRGRYLLPLFFLGKGSGLSKWIHKSRLDAIIEEKVDAELADEQYERNEKKWGLIDKMWFNGDVWRVPEIQDILLPVQVDSTMMPQEHEEVCLECVRNEEVFVCVGGKKIVATKAEPDASTLSPIYLGFTIQGPVLYRC